MGLIVFFLWPGAVALGSKTLSDADHTHVVQTADATSLGDNKDTISRIRGFDQGISYIACIDVSKKIKKYSCGCFGPLHTVAVSVSQDGVISGSDEAVTP
jgi:hypothetical protein